MSAAMSINTQLNEVPVDGKGESDSFRQSKAPGLKKKADNFPTGSG